MSTREMTIEPDFKAHVALPASGSGRGLLLLHDILGVNEHVRDAARRLAGLGYVVLAPDLYWRTEPGLELGPDDAEHAFYAMENLNKGQAVRDAITSLGTMTQMPEVLWTPRGFITNCPRGVFGFGFGGTLAWQVAAEDDPEVAVCYYGAGIPNALAEKRRIRGPVLLHFGDADPDIPYKQYARVASVASSRLECRIHKGAGHAFDNSFSPQLYNPPAAAAAWELTTEFLARNLPPQ